MVELINSTGDSNAEIYHEQIYEILYSPEPPKNDTANVTPQDSSKPDLPSLETMLNMHYSLEIEYWSAYLASLKDVENQDVIDRLAEDLQKCRPFAKSSPARIVSTDMSRSCFYDGHSVDQFQHALNLSHIIVSQKFSAWMSQFHSSK